MSYDAFPLQWPDGWPRAMRRSDAPYLVEFEKARNELKDEIRKMGGRGLVISSNVPTRQDGEPYASSANKRYADPGVAVYFQRKGEQIAIACDHWTRVKDNLRAVGLTIKAMRQIERCGATELLNRAFTGFKALPAPENWWEVLGVDEHATSAEIRTAYLIKIEKAHPDHGGSHDEASRINGAYEMGMGV